MALRFLPHLREDARDLQGPVRAEVDTQSEQRVDLGARCISKGIKGLANHPCV